MLSRAFPRTSHPRTTALPGLHRCVRFSGCSDSVDIQIVLLSTGDVAQRLRRVEQVERNREVVLAAARQVFISNGYAGATLEGIATEAGFSTGVVYSQFGSKADLFFALLERRIAERAAQNERVV